MDGTFLYFAYGSNMFTKRLKERTPSAEKFGIGIVCGRRLTWDKISKDGSGKCDIEPTDDPSNCVWGVLFIINLSEKSNLDKAEGAGKGYKEESIQVKIAGDSYNAITYVATEKAETIRPYHWYKAYVVSGAIEHGLPVTYIEWLRTAESLQDQNATRREKSEKILFSS